MEGDGYGRQDGDGREEGGEMGARQPGRAGRPKHAMGCSSPGDQLHRNVEGRKQRTGKGRKQQRETTKQHERPGSGPGGEEDESGSVSPGNTANTAQ